MGQAAALAFAREGASVVGCDVNVAGTKATVEMVRAQGGIIGRSANTSKWVII